MWDQLSSSFRQTLSVHSPPDKRHAAHITSSVTTFAPKASEPLGQTGALAPAMLKPRGRECRFSLVIIGLCHICQLVASQTPIRLSSFKIIVYFKTGATRCQILKRNAPNSISSVPLGSLQHSQGPLAIFKGSLIKGGSREGGKKKARERGSGEKREGRIASSNWEVWIRQWSREGRENADRPADPPYPPPSVCAECTTDISSPPIRPHHGRAHQLTLVTSTGKDCVQGRSADLPGTTL